MDTSWETREDGDELTIIHDNRWLAIVGVPLAMFGLAVAIGPWLLEEVRKPDNYLILGGGSVVGAGLLTAGLSLCFLYMQVVANRRTGQCTRHVGIPPFRRTTNWSLDQFDKVICVNETLRSLSATSSTHFRVRLVGPSDSVLIASSLESEPIRMEAERWSDFLRIPLEA
ncbi:hypothetical protein [Aeoliella sp.]|uniref:hypothetical protein n=1 Tax=Aeoliella sp. TaxID=2795800 RepID=UPI003CCC2CFF